MTGNLFLKTDYNHRPEAYIGFLSKSAGLAHNTEEVLGHACVREALGSLAGQHILDFGCNWGEQCRDLHQRGALVTGVDISWGPLERAISLQGQDATPIRYARCVPGHLAEQVPGPFDMAVSSFVFCTMETRDEIRTALRDLHAVLRDGGRLVILNNNPQRSLGRHFLTFTMEAPPDLHSGDAFVAILNGEQPLPVRNFFWSHQDYRSLLEESGFEVEAVLEPLAPRGQEGWLDETCHPPHVLFVARRQ